MAYYVLGVGGLLFLFLIVSMIMGARRESNQLRATVETRLGTRCNTCFEGKAKYYTFRTCRCIGVAPLAAAWKTKNSGAYLCDPCARRQAIAASRELGLYGGWGFPGVIAVVIYTIGNVGSLMRNRSADARTVAVCLVFGVLLPWILLVVGVVLLLLALMLIDRLWHG
ncbi:MAG TPA: hypothetical protein PKN33_11230 [Phycisphaerae bacterium]|nr:hypothetical protein [Phycisphaerae bacterium]